MLPYLQADMLACHSFVVAVKKQETPGSGTKGFITYGTAGSMGISIIVLVLLFLRSHVLMQRSLHTKWVNYRETSELRELESFVIGSKHAYLLLQRERHHVYLSRLFAIQIFWKR